MATKIITRKNGKSVEGKSVNRLLVEVRPGVRITLHHSLPNATVSALKRNLEKVIREINLTNETTTTV